MFLRYTQQVPPKIPPSDHSLIVQQYLNRTVTVADIAQRYACSLTIVYKILEKQGIERRKDSNRRLSDADESELLRLYRDGHPVPDLLDRFGITMPGFFKLRHRHGVPARERVPTPRKLSAQTERDIAAAYEAGDSLSQLSAVHGVCIGTIRSALGRQGIKCRPKGNTWKDLTEDQRAAVVERYLSGESQQSIGKALGVSQPVISRVVRRMGLIGRRAERHRHGNWVGGRIAHAQGYVLILIRDDDPLRPYANVTGYMLEHRYVMAQHLRRPLLPSETVHHINGKRDDNRLENLQLRQGRHGNGVAMACLACGSHNVREVPLN